jgi:hypothetical protein
LGNFGTRGSFEQLSKTCLKVLNSDFGFVDAENMGFRQVLNTLLLLLLYINILEEIEERRNRKKVELIFWFWNL